jgi:protein phosphatase
LIEELSAIALRLERSALTDSGRKRSHNEDAYAILELEQHSSIGAELTLAAVADGMGGHASGEVASTLALDLLRQQLMLGLLAPRSTPRDASQLGPQLKQIIVSIDHALTERANFDAALAGMGTTLCGIAMLQPLSTMEMPPASSSSVVFWVGDSRAYLLGPLGLAQISRDHSFVQNLVDSGSLPADQAFNHPNKNIITRCLGGGGGSEGTPDIADFTAGPGEIILLASDGLSDALRDEEIWKSVCEVDSGELADLARHLIDKANEAGGPDNITVILIACALQH